MVKNPPVRQEKLEIRIQSLAQEYPLEEGMATHSSILAWRILWTEEPNGLQSIGLQRVKLSDETTTGIRIKANSGGYTKIVDGDFLEMWRLGQFLLLFLYFSVFFIFYNKSSL